LAGEKYLQLTAAIGQNYLSIYLQNYYFDKHKKKNLVSDSGA